MYNAIRIDFWNTAITTWITFTGNGTWNEIVTEYTCTQSIRNVEQEQRDRRIRKIRKFWCLSYAFDSIFKLILNIIFEKSFHFTYACIFKAYIKTMLNVNITILKFRFRNRLIETYIKLLNTCEQLWVWFECDIICKWRNSCDIEMSNEWLAI